MSHCALSRLCGWSPLSCNHGHVMEKLRDSMYLQKRSLWSLIRIQQELSTFLLQRLVSYHIYLCSQENQVRLEAKMTRRRTCYLFKMKKKPVTWLVERMNWLLVEYVSSLKISGFSMLSSFAILRSPRRWLSIAIPVIAYEIIVFLVSLFNNWINIMANGLKYLLQLYNLSGH